MATYQDFPEARRPSYKLVIDLGSEFEMKKSCGQYVANQLKEELEGRLVARVVNFSSRQIGPAVSEVLTFGFSDQNGNVVLVSPTKEVPLGGRPF